MIGEMSALGCALLWALSSILIRPQTGRVDAFFINAFRCLVTAVLFVGAMLGLGQLPELLGYAPRTIAVLAAAAVLGFVFGDSFYYQSMALVGVSKTLPISAAYPIFTLVVSLVVFGRPITGVDCLGGVVVVLGVYLVGSSGWRRPKPARSQQAKGVTFAILAALSWSFSINLLKLGLEEASIVVASAFRMTIAAIVLTIMVLVRHKGAPPLAEYGSRSLLIISVSGIIGLGGGSLLIVTAVKYAEAGRAAVLSAAAPLFAVPMARVFLKEQLTLRLTAGAALSMAGIWLILSQGS